MPYEAVLQRLKSLANPDNAAGMARFGINPQSVLGVSIPDLRKIAREAGKDHAIAGELWASGIHEARILATLTDRPQQVTEEQMERWALDFDSWDVCDQCCNNLFDKTEFAYAKATEWSVREEEFVKRAGVVLMATLAVHDKKAPADRFAQFLPLIRGGSTDGRNFVKKAVNWALRQIGKRNANLNALAVEAASELQAMDSRAARWVAADALRELTSDKVRQRLAE
jgi:3-methyladenine DNA glycosylase AlkD